MDSAALHPSWVAGFVRMAADRGYLVVKPKIPGPIRTLAVMLVLISCAPVLPPEASVSAEPAPAPYGQAVRTGYLANEALSEVSGLAASRRSTGLLWAINDSGNGAYLYALGADGTDYGRVRLLNAENVDWEDLAAFRFENDSFLLVADFGDNQARRDVCVLYILAEPEVPADGFAATAAVGWQRRIVYRYADGPRDCESVAVDPQLGRIYLLTKRREPPQLYELPLVPRGAHLQVAQKIAELQNLANAAAQIPTALLTTTGPYAHQPTAMDFSADRSLAVVLTYGGGFLFERREAELWPDAMARMPRHINLPELRQAEAACFAFPRASLFVTSERRPAPLYRIEPAKTGP